MDSDFNVLISSAGRRVSLLNAFRRALEQLQQPGRVFATDLTPLSSAYQSADGTFLSGRFEDSSYVPDLLEECKRHGIRLLIPTIDTELLLYARNRSVFEEAGVRIPVSSPEAIEICSDKVRTHEWLVSNGFPCPRQASRQEVLAHPAEWPLPLLAKPRRGSSSVGLIWVRSAADLDYAANFEDLVYQTVESGREHTVDVFVDRQGQPRCAVPRRRLETRGGEVSKGMTVRDEALQSIALDVCGALPSAEGALNVQVFCDEATGRLSVIECNPRFGGGYPLTDEAGARYARWLIEGSLDLPSTVSADGWIDGLVMLRYDEAVFVHSGVVGDEYVE